jgi:hypothetical protein
LTAGSVARLPGIQRRLQRFYGLDVAPDVREFVQDGADDSREHLLLREHAGTLELALVLPPPGESADHALQLVEGVSHFLLLWERARTGLPTTLLELELQAEVDKYVFLTMVARRALSPVRARSLHGKLYDHVTFLHPPHTEEGRRYRLANDLAARFVARAVAPLVARDGLGSARPVLARFYRFGQTDKIRWASAA